jgi:hypothetical protein
VVEFAIFPEDDSFVGVCLTFDIVVEGNNYDEVRHQLIDAASVHIETVRKNNLSADLLNRPAPKEYWNKRDAQDLIFGIETRSFESLRSGLVSSA